MAAAVIRQDSLKRLHRGPALDSLRSAGSLSAELPNIRLELFPLAASAHGRRSVFGINYCRI